MIRKSEIWCHGTAPWPFGTSAAAGAAGAARRAFCEEWARCFCAARHAARSFDGAASATGAGALFVPTFTGGIGSFAASFPHTEDAGTGGGFTGSAIAAGNAPAPSANTDSATISERLARTWACFCINFPPRKVTYRWPRWSPEAHTFTQIPHGCAGGAPKHRT
ncbi:hypothetical protein ACIQM4_27835 [Streptomyces sp. NPDC091272]|uniref:hypothetical protein n=1 Tax=Streptomyces sp. NPDC091272 TaxID=3365981 RepID=UPI00382201F4